MKLSFRYAIAAIVMAGALFLLSPTLMPEDINLPGASRISLGLDLKGGVQLTLGVDTEKAVQSALINSGQVLRQKAREAGITVLGPRQMPGGVQELIIARANQVNAFLALAKKDAPQVVPGTPRTGADGAVHLPYSFTPAFSTASTSRAALRRRSGSSTPFRTSSSSGRLIPCISKA